MFKKLQNILIIFLCVVSLSFIGCNKAQEPQSTIPTLNVSQLELHVNDTYKLIVENYNDKIEWETSNYKIATIDEYGVITCVGLGNVTITAIAGETKLTCRVSSTIAYVSVPKLELDGEILTDNVYKLTLLLDGEDAEYELTPFLKLEGEVLEGITYTIKSEDSAKVSVDGTKVIAKTTTSGTKVTVSCVYNDITYSVNVIVIVEG